MKRKVIWLLVSGLMVVSLVLASCAPAVTEEEEKAAPAAPAPAEKEKEAPPEEEEVVAPAEKGPRYGGVLTQASSVAPINFDNALTHISTAETLHFTNETLLGADWAKGPAGTGEASLLYLMMPAPAIRKGFLAESWEVPEPGTLVFHIRKGVYWHDKPPTNGREMTADDVVRTLRHLMQTEGSVYYRDDTKYFESFDSITMPDKWTVVMKVLPGQIGPVFERYVSFMRVMPADALDEYGDLGDWRNSIGTGPWILVDYVSGSSATFERNPNYWMKDPLHPENQLPYIDSVKLLIIPDVSTRMAALRTAKIDYLVWVAWEEAESLIKTNPDLKYLKYPSGTATAINWRVDKPELPWYDVRVRRALAMAIDQQEIADTYYGGNAQVVAWPVGGIPEQTHLYTPLEELPEEARELFEYHPDKAKQLLVEAGYPDGFKAEIISYQTPDQVDLLAITKDYWARIGVDLKLDVREYGAYVSVLYGRTYDMIIAGLGAYYPYSFYHSVPKQAWNYSEIDDPRLNEAYDIITENYWDDELRDRTMKEIIPYELGQSYRLLFPSADVYNFWWPWLKGYSGERMLGFYHHTTMQQYIWIDQDLKEEMTGKR